MVCFNNSKYTPQQFRTEIFENGFCLIENVIDKETIKSLKLATKHAIKQEAEYHGCTNYSDYEVIQACPMYGGVFLSLLEDRKLIEPYNLIMGEGCILYSYISLSKPPDSSNYSSRIHVDRAHFFRIIANVSEEFCCWMISRKTMGQPYIFLLPIKLKNNLKKFFLQ